MVRSGMYIPPQRIIDAALEPQFEYKLGFRALRSHMEKCLGFKR